MAHRKMIMTKAGAQNYRTRMLSAGDPITLSGRDARMFEKIGWAEPPRTTLGEARKAHKVKFGKFPGPKATVDEILAKIAAA